MTGSYTELCTEELRGIGSYKVFHKLLYRHYADFLGMKRCVTANSRRNLAVRQYKICS